ncbi:glycosyltransferase [Actinoplanes sp. NPDC020271]|uniref:glycosyltransferase n=1 Tax=Actinoplanes sp. NPDC020271 TaxID=3363896 RepID=UPI0037B5CCF0
MVPAHNERDRLPRCLSALRVAAARVAVPVRLIVVADACTDDTAALAAAGGAEVVTITARNVGRARAAGAARALKAGRARRRDAAGTAAGEGRARGRRVDWIATTDADSRVPQGWLRRQLDHARDGADLVAGTVEVDDWSGWPHPLPSEYQRRYAERVAGDRHGHVHGANLGVRATAYVAAGGFPPVAHDEDRALVAAVRGNGGQVVFDSRCPVLTSARPDGRAPGGFSVHLKNLYDRSVFL